MLRQSLQRARVRGRDGAPDERKFAGAGSPLRTRARGTRARKPLPPIATGKPGEQLDVGLAEYLTLSALCSVSAISLIKFSHHHFAPAEVTTWVEAAVPPPGGYFRIVAAGSTITTQVLWLFGQKFNQAIGSDEKKVGNWD